MRVYEEFTRTITTKEPVGFKCDCCSTESKKRMDQVQMNHNGWEMTASIRMLQKIIAL